MHVLPNLKYLLFYSLTAETYFGVFISYVYPFLAQEIYESLTLAKHKSKSRFIVPFVVACIVRVSFNRTYIELKVKKLGLSKTSLVIVCGMPSKVIWQIEYSLL